MAQLILAILCEGLSSFDPKRLCYSYAWSCSLWEGRNSFCTGLISRKLCEFLFMFSTDFTSFSSINQFFHLYVRFLTLFHLKWMRFSRSLHLLCFSLEILISIIRAGWPILVELIDLGNSGIIFVPQMTLLRRLTFILGSLTSTLTVLLFLNLFLSFNASMFYNSFPSIGIFLSCCCLSFHWLSVKL